MANRNPVTLPGGGRGYGTKDDSDEENYDYYSFAFQSKSVRRNFIRKVLFIVLIQLIFFTAVVLICTYSIPTKEFFFEVFIRRHFWIAIAVIEFIVLIALGCFPGVARTTPTNYILLIIFTVCSAFMSGCLVIFFKSDTVCYNPLNNDVLLAIALTTVVVLTLTVFAMQTKIDFTICGGVLCVALILLLIMGLVLMFFPSKILHTVYCSIGLILFSIYLIYDIQLLMGNHQFSFDPEDYIIAALSIYIDIINIFLYILQLLNDS